MERYFPVISRPSSTCKQERERKKTREATKFRPYTAGRPLPCEDEEKLVPRRSRRGEDQVVSDLKSSKALVCDQKMSSSSLSRLVIGTLKDGVNPITNSDISQRTDYVNSTSTGHQHGDVNRGHSLYMRDRERKLKIQRKATEDEDEPESQVLKFVRVYIDGYLEDTTDIEMKRIVTNAGGHITGTPSGCTHIVTSMVLNGSKTQRFLASKSRSKIHVVKPEWVFDSIEAGRRKPEREYAMVKCTNARTMESMLK